MELNASSANIGPIQFLRCTCQHTRDVPASTQKIAWPGHWQASFDFSKVQRIQFAAKCNSQATLVFGPRNVTCKESLSVFVSTGTAILSSLKALTPISLEPSET